MRNYFHSHEKIQSNENNNNNGSGVGLHSFVLCFLSFLQSVIQMHGFRSLGDEEEVEFECKASDKGLEATMVAGLEGGECKGSHRRPMSKKKFKKIR